MLIVLGISGQSSRICSEAAPSASVGSAISLWRVKSQLRLAFAKALYVLCSHIYTHIIAYLTDMAFHAYSRHVYSTQKTNSSIKINVSA